MELPEEVKMQRAITRRGRPSKLTAEITKTIADAIKRGNYIETAAALASINQDTMRDWLKKGARAKSGKYKDFSESIKRAMAEWEDRDLAIIDKAADGYDVVKQKALQKRNSKTGELEIIEQTVERTREFSWTAAAWRLERKLPNKWGRRDHIEMSTDPDAPLKVDVQIQQPVNLYDDPQKLAEFMAALVEASLIPAIDITPKLNGPNGMVHE